MADYTFYVLGFDGYLVEGVSASCLDDMAALEHGNSLLASFDAAVEVWDGARKVEGFSERLRPL